MIQFLSTSTKIFDSFHKNYFLFEKKFDDFDTVFDVGAHKGGNELYIKHSKLKTLLL